MYKNKKISLVIPAYNEEKLIIPTLKNVPRLVDRIYVVDDASKDNMFNVLRVLQKKDKRIKIIKHHKNQGPGIGIINGYKKSSEEGYDIAVVIGGDNQMDLSEVTKFLNPIITNEADYVKGNRFMLGGNAYHDMPLKRFIGNSFLTFLTKFASGYWKLFDTQDGYTAISKEMIDKVDWGKAKVGYGYVSDFLILLNVYNSRIKDVPRKAIYLPGERQSQIKIFRYILKVGPRIIKKFFWRLNHKYFFQDFHPLLFMYYFGILFLTIGTIFAIKIFINGLTGNVSANQAIFASLLLISGLQFFLFAVFFDMENNKHLCV
ncbi:MAG: glycosyltransferase family 2 protein [Nanoarchaeota archaeon]